MGGRGGIGSSSAAGLGHGNGDADEVVALKMLTATDDGGPSGRAYRAPKQLLLMRVGGWGLHNILLRECSQQIMTVISFMKGFKSPASPAG